MQRIRDKIFAALIVIVVLMLAPTTYAVLALRRVNELTVEIRQSSALRVDTRRDLLWDCQRFDDLHGVTGDADYAREAERCAGRLSRQVIQIAAQVEPRHPEAAADLRAAGECYGRTVFGITEAIGGSSDRGDCAVRVDEALQSLQAAEVSHRTTLMAEVDRISRRAVNVLFLSVAGTLIVAVVITSGLARGIVLPLRRILLGTQELAQGKFDHQIAVTTRDETGDLTREFNRMATELRSLNQMKAEFLSIASHELKAPITSVLGYLDILRTEGESLEASERQRIVEFLEEETRLLLRYINQFLDMNRLEAGRLRFEPRDVPLAPFFRSEIEGFSYRARGREIELHIDVEADLPEEIRADPDRLGEVVRNLLGNALRYTPSGGSVTARLSPEGNSALRFEVEDTGPGVPEAERERIFDRYFRGTHAEGKRGSGLGLAISRAIVEAHGGELWMEPVQPHGARFICRLPVGRVESPARVEAV
ncbi:MAG: HAMP domain-containing sensor histidine kinase [Acidobacteriota bacterium]|jgi:signal transduction histidine kinase